MLLKLIHNQKLPLLSHYLNLALMAISMIMIRWYLTNFKPTMMKLSPNNYKKEEAAWAAAVLAVEPVASTKTCQILTLEKLIQFKTSN